MRPLFLFLLVLLAARVVVWAAEPTVYPVTYSGGVSRTIFTDLTLHDAHTYTYDEWTHAGYSVHDSGHYSMSKRRLVLSSLATVHERRNRWHRVNGKRVNLPDTLIYDRLFRRTEARHNADTVIITTRRVLVNEEFGMFLVKQK